MGWGGPKGQVSAVIAMNEPGVGVQGKCTVPVTVGACQFVSCKFGGIGDPTFGYGDFGTFSAVVGSNREPLAYSQQGYGTVDFPASVGLEPGGVMRFFSDDNFGVASAPLIGIDAVIPGNAQVTSPIAGTANGTVTIDTTQDLTVRWEPFSIGTMTYAVFAGQLAGASIQCNFDGASGSGVVDKSLLAAVQASGDTPVNESWGSVREATTTIDGIEIITDSYYFDSNAISPYAVTLQ